MPHNSSPTKSIFQVFSFHLISKVLVGLGGVILIHFMPEVEYARYTLILAVVTFSTEFLASSFNQIYIVGYQRLGLKEFSSSFLGLQIWGILILVIVLFPLSGFLDGLYWVASFLVVITCLSEFSKTYFQRELRFFVFSMIEVARASVFGCSLLALAYIVRDDLKTWQVLLVQAMTLLTVFVVVFVKYLNMNELFKFRKIIHLAVTVGKEEYRYVFGYFAVLALFSQLDVFMLRAMASDLELATYGSAFRYYSLLLIALTAVHRVLLPSIQQVQNTADLQSIFRKYRKFLLVFSLVVLLGAWISQWIIPLIDTGKYPSAVIVFRILAISSIISFAFSPHVNLLLRFEDFRFLFCLICVAVLLNVTLNSVLIVKLGAVGAAIATLIAFGCLNGAVFLRGRVYRNVLAPILQGAN